jgi:Protein of unknown function (DUF1365)
VTSIERTPHGVIVHDSHGGSDTYDHVVIASHSDLALAMLSEGPLLAATFHGRRGDLTTAALLRSLFALPLVTLKIVAAIHWEALRLWLKGARLVPRPHTAPANIAFTTTLATGERNDYNAATLPAGARRKPGPRESALIQ